MFKFTNLTSVHLEISNRCQASCPMCPRNIHSGIENTLLKNADWTLSEFKIVFPKEVLTQLTKISFCGTFGDPMMNNDLIDMIRYITESAPHMDIRIHTNGGARSISWWEELTKALPKKHTIEFGIDGLADTHHLHRVGTQFDRVIEHAQAVINAGGNASWLFIRFKHNEHQAEEARTLSNKLGFKQFVLKNTRRFDDQSFVVLDRKGTVSHLLEPPTDNVVTFVNKTDLENYQAWPNATDINCFALDSTEIYIDANFTVMPCCIISAFLYTNYDTDILKKYNLYNESLSINSVGGKIQKQVFDIIQEFGGITKLDARTQGIEQIINSETWQTLWKEKWSTNSSTCCTVMCSSDSPYTKLKEQFIKDNV